MAGVRRTPPSFLSPAKGPQWKVVATVQAGDEVPSDLPRCAAVLVSPKGRPTWIVFDCPCRAKHRIMLNLDLHRRPAWRLVRVEPLTVSPSVNMSAAGRACHFFLWNGQVLWVRESPQRRPR